MELQGRSTLKGHARRIGWIGTSALALAGSNASLYLIGSLFIGENAIPGQGSAAVPLLILGVILSWGALPGWIELVLLSPNRVGGIAAACSAAFEPYSPVLSALAGCCYWWGWVPSCGLTAILAASAIHQWLLPWIPITAIALGIIGFFVAINLCSIRAIVTFAVPLAAVSAALAFISAIVPVVTGHVDWHTATTFHLTTPFGGWFGTVTSLMAGLYLVGFAAPAFEAALCHVGETVDPVRNVPRSAITSAGLAGLYFIVLPVIWLGVIGPQALGRDLATELGPTFAPLFGAGAKGMAIGFMVFNMLHGTLQPLAGPSRTISQLADDGFLPRFLSRRNTNDVPWAATLVTAAAATTFMLVGDPIWLIAAANFTYLISICLPSIAVWLLRRDAPNLERSYRAPRGTIALGVGVAAIWTIAAILGFEQFGLRTVIMGLIFAYSGAAFYGWRVLEDRHRDGLRGFPDTIHLKLTGAMVAVLLFDGVGYFIAIEHLVRADASMVAALQDIFVVVALLTVGVGLVLPGMVAHDATRHLAIVNGRLHHVAFHDDLTQLPNRAMLMDRFKQMIARTQRRNDHMAAVLFLDLDRFKFVNDSLGHLVGDALLVAVARRLERCMRPGDTLARFGGDEFTILLEDIGSVRDATVVAERVLAELALPFQIADHQMFASASIGVAITRTGFDLSDDVLRDADIAMYRAKALGKGRYEVFAPELLARAAALLQLEQDLKGAVDRNEFVLYYQPIVSFETNGLIGFEALIRWQHPQQGLLAPDKFIAAAEESGAILKIGNWVIQEACLQARRWQDRFRLQRPLGISVNVSAKQFSDPDLFEIIADAMAANGLTSDHVHVEITESAIMEHLDTARDMLVKLRANGLAVHLDDFGTGYSSLSYLNRFPIDTLKIDRSFVSMSVKAGLANPEIIRTIITLARSLFMETTAEGIETREQYEELRALNCTKGQGYYFSPPVDGAAASLLIAKWGERDPLLMLSGSPSYDTAS